MESLIERIENAKSRKIIPLIWIILGESLSAESWNNHDINRGAASIDLDFHHNLRNVAIDKLKYFGFREKEIQKWYDAFRARVNEFGIYEDQICSEMVDGTIPMENLSKLLSPKKEVFEKELYEIMDKQSNADCALAREFGYLNAIPMSCKTKYYPQSDAKGLKLSNS